MTEDWPEPWFSTDERGRRLLADELKRELNETHPLANVPFVVVARRLDQDDVLVTLDKGRVAEVHLTWSGKEEADPRQPSMVVFESMELWRRQLNRESSVE